jgi:filamentous hemagglutinin family protein
LSLAVAVALTASPNAHAGPQGGQVVAGSATITQTSPNRVDVVQSSGKAIVDWRSFSIGAGERTHFQQPSSAAATLNRVKGGDPSRILGQLTANGQVMLVNPNGVFFGAGSRVDVGALMASTADVANDDFLAGRYRFTTPSPNADAGIVNQGEIRAADGGFVVLAAPYVRNEGRIQARLGQVVLAGAPTFTVDFDGDGLLQFDVGGPVTSAPRGEDGQPVDALVANPGTVQADGGRVTLTARAADQVIDRVIHMGGVVQARTVESRGGEIILGGGDVGTVAVAGTLDASGPGAGQNGGTVKVLGERVGLLDGARVDASGGAGGGKVLVGGNFRARARSPTPAGPLSRARPA